MNENLKREIKAAVLAYQAPDILALIEEVCQAESDCHLKEWTASAEFKKKLEEDMNPASYLQQEKRRNESARPAWVWWQFFGHSLDYVARDMRKQIEQKDMTQGEIDQINRDAEIERKREELVRLERR